MRLLIVAPSIVRGGVEEYMLSIASEAAKEGWDVHAAFPKVKGTASLIHDLRDNGVEYHLLSISEQKYRRLAKLKRDLPNLARTARLLRQLRPNVVQVNLPYISHCFGSVLACSLLRAPTVVAFHLVPNGHSFTVRRKKAYAWARSRGQQWLTVSDYSREQVSTAFGIPRDQIARIYNGAISRPDAVDELNNTLLRRRIREEMGFSANAILALTVGRLENHKGHTDLIQVIPDIVREFPNLRFVWTGEGNQRDELTRRLRDSGIDDRVLLMGYRPDISRYFTAADLFVFPTHLEGSPIVIAEAMLHGLPIVSSDASGISEIIEDRVNGLLFKTGDSRHLLNSLRWALSHPDQMQDMARNARSLARQKLSREKMVNDTLEMLKASAISK